VIVTRRAGLRCVLLLAALAVAMLAFAGTADAKKKKKKNLGPVVTATATATGTGGASNIISATATCPSGTKAVGGGFSLPPLAPGLLAVGLGTASHKVGTTQWLSSAQILGSPSGSVVLTTNVYCRKGAPATTSVSTPTALPQVGGTSPVPVTASNATCPAKTVQMSGGFTVDRIAGSGTTLPLSSSRLDPLTWQATGLSTEAGRTLTSQVDCAKQPKAKKGKKSEAAKKKKQKLKSPVEVTGDTSSAGGASVTAIATCPAGTVPVTGGFSQPGALQSTTAPFFYVLTASQAVGNTWQVTGFNETSSQGTLRSHGYCAK
jgi:hypothetical protein